MKYAFLALVTIFGTVAHADNVGWANLKSGQSQVVNVLLNGTTLNGLPTAPVTIACDSKAVSMGSASTNFEVHLKIGSSMNFRVASGQVMEFNCVQ